MILFFSPRLCVSVVQFFLNKGRVFADRAAMVAFGRPTRRGPAQPLECVKESSSFAQCEEQL